MAMIPLIRQLYGFLPLQIIILKFELATYFHLTDILTSNCQISC